MLNENLRGYIANLPIDTFHSFIHPQASATLMTVDIDKLPDGLITGSNLIQFPKEASSELRSAVALSLLLAQRVASNDHLVMTPQQWIERHNTVLTNIGWLVEGGGDVASQFDNINVAVHEAIIPFLEAAFAPAGALILDALKQLKEMDQNSPWITLFDQQSRRFDVTEYQFSTVQVIDDQVHLKLVSARLGADFGKTQVLFFKLNREHATFESESFTCSTQAKLLAEMDGDLKVKLSKFVHSFIQSIPDNQLGGA